MFHLESAVAVWPCRDEFCLALLFALPVKQKKYELPFHDYSQVRFIIAMFIWE
jgi:hypothetical protein